MWLHGSHHSAPTASTSTQGDGLSLGTLQSGALLGAYNTRKAVVALNVFPGDGAWKGDLRNAFDELAY